MGWQWVLAAVLALGAAGCAPGGDQSSFQHGPGQLPAGPLASSASAGGRESLHSAGGPNLTVVRMQFDVMRVDLPVREIKHSLKIWNHVDESKTDPRLTALLARNGFRIGVADRDAEPAIRTIFEENEARLGRARHDVDDGLPLMLSLGSVEEGGTYFVHRKDGGLIGQTFQAETMFFRIDYLVTDEQPPRIVLQVTPELRGERTKTRWVDQGGEIRSIRTYDGTVFDELSAMFTLEPGQFLVVGTSARAQRGYLLGSWWLTSELNAQEYETVLCITPQPFGIRPGPRRDGPGGS